MFEIPGALRTHLTLDKATKKRTFGHFARVLLEVYLTSDMRERILIEKKDFDFYADVEYEKLTTFCNSDIQPQEPTNLRGPIPPPTCGRPH